MQRPGTSSARPQTASGRPRTAAGGPSYNNPYRNQAHNDFADAGGEQGGEAVDDDDSQFQYNNEFAAHDAYAYDADANDYYDRTSTAGGAFAHHPPEALYEEDEEQYEESSDDGDVFAYLPPTTADQVEPEEAVPTHVDNHPQPQGDPPSYPVYPGIESYDLQHQPQPLETNVPSLSSQSHPDLQTPPSHPPNAVVANHAPQVFSSHISPFATSPANFDPGLNSPLSPYAPQQTSSVIPQQQPYVPDALSGGDAYQMRQLGPPPSTGFTSMTSDSEYGFPAPSIPPNSNPPVNAASSVPAALPSQPNMTSIPSAPVSHQASSQPRNHSASTGHPPSSGGMVSITTRSGASSREVHVTLPQTLKSPSEGSGGADDDDDDGDGDGEGEGRAIPGASVPRVSVTVVGGPGHVVSHPLDGSSVTSAGIAGVPSARPLRTGDGEAIALNGNGAVGLIAPGTPTQDIDNLYYEDPAKGYRRATRTGAMTADSTLSAATGDGAPRKRRVRRLRTGSSRRRRVKTASSLGTTGGGDSTFNGTGGTAVDRTSHVDEDGYMYDDVEEYEIDDEDVLGYDDVDDGVYDDDGGVYSDGASAAWASHPAGGRAKDGGPIVVTNSNDVDVDDKLVVENGKLGIDAGSPKHGHGHHRSTSTNRHRLSQPGTANSNGGLGSGGQFYRHHHHHPGDLEGDTASIPFSDEDEDSPYPEVRASVSNIDDPEMPVLTLRMWILGLSLCILGAAANTFFNFRYPAPSIAPIVLLLIAHPCGKFLAYTMPIDSWAVRIPAGGIRVLRWLDLGRWWRVGRRAWNRRRRRGALDKAEEEERERDDLAVPWEWEIQLNPGPFNIKEHAIIYIMTNVSVYPAYALNATVVARLDYHINLSIGFNFLIVIATQLSGFGIAGMCRRFLVWPASLIWPQNLVACTLLNTLHAEDEEGSTGITRYRFFVLATGVAAVWTFFPSFIFQALSAFSWICWMAPNNVVVNQLFGVESGLGMGILTFDWNQIAYIGSPLMVPWWAEVHIMVGFVTTYWLVVPLLYYSNVWHFAHFPMMGQSPYDRFGQPYNVTRVLNVVDDSFNVTAYDDYSPLYLTINYALTYLLAFSLTTCILVHTALYHGNVLMKGMKRMKTEDDDIHAKLMRYYPEVPDWWYFSIFFSFFVMGMLSVALFPTHVPFWSLFVAVLFPFIYILPSGFVYAYTAQSVSINLISESVAGILIQGKPFTNMIFKAYSTQTMTVAINFLQDLKLGHYIKLPPRATFIAQLVATFLTAVVQVGVQDSLFETVPDICTQGQPSHLVCPHTQVFYSSSAIWGVIGPTRQFGAHALYKPELYALAIGAVLPIPFWWWQKRHPKSWLKYFSMPVLLNGPSFIPPALGINYSSWFVVAFVFQYLIRRRNFRWWSKFNYILSSSLDSGTTIGLIVIFLTLQLPKGGTINVNWWGNSVMDNTADARGQPYRPGPF